MNSIIYFIVGAHGTRLKFKKVHDNPFHIISKPRIPQKKVS